MPFESQLARDWSSVQFHPTSRGFNDDDIVEDLRKIADCIENLDHEVSGETYALIKESISRIATEADELSVLPFPTRQAFFRALQWQDASNEVLQELDPLARNYPVCLFRDDKNEFVVILYVTLRAPTWVTSTENLTNGESIIAHRGARHGYYYTVVRDAIEESDTDSNAGHEKPCQTNFLPDSLPLGEIYVFPAARWDLEMSKDLGGIYFPDECRTNFYAVLGQEREVAERGMQIWAVYNYYPDRVVDGGTIYNLEPIDWNPQDLLLTLLRDESELTSQMVSSGILKKIDKARFKFDIMPLVDVSGAVSTFGGVKRLAMDYGHMMRPALAPYPVPTSVPPVLSVKKEEQFEAVQEWGASNNNSSQGWGTPTQYVKPELDGWLRPWPETAAMRVTPQYETPTPKRYSVGAGWGRLSSPVRVVRSATPGFFSSGAQEVAISSEGKTLTPETGSNPSGAPEEGSSPGPGYSSHLVKVKKEEDLGSPWRGSETYGPGVYTPEGSDIGGDEFVNRGAW